MTGQIHTNIAMIPILWMHPEAISPRKGTMPTIIYSLEPSLTVGEFVDLLQRSTLAARRPVDDLTRIAGMLANADLIVSARDSKGVLVGVSRAITDFHYCTYLSDLAVDRAFQGQGIGRELIARTHQSAGRATTLILLAAPAAATYYPHLGMEQHPSCWITRGNAGNREPPLPGNQE